MIKVDQATPTIAWTDPAEIIYGTALSATQLDATASVPGTLTYTPAAGTILGAGAGQTLSSAHTTDTTDYNTASVSVQITVDKAKPMITWVNPAAITFGTPLSGTQLDAAPSVPGTMTYLPPPGTVLPVGSGQSLSGRAHAERHRRLHDSHRHGRDQRRKATPTITWPSPASITYGTALSATQLDATANVAGTFDYTPAAGTFLDAGTNQTLSLTFTPDDSADYVAVTATASLTVQKATPTFDLSDTGGTYNGSPYAAAVTIAGAGSNNAPSSSLLGVTPTLTYYNGASPSGTNLGSTPPVAAGTYTVVASFPGSLDYAAVASAPVTFTIEPATTTVGLSASSGSTVFGQPVTLVATVAAAAASGGSITFRDGATMLAVVPVGTSGAASFVASGLSAGTHAITSTYSGNGNFSAADSQSATETIRQAASAISLSPKPTLKKKKVISETLTANVGPTFSSAAAPTGIVTFEIVTKKRKKVHTQILGTARVVAGAGAMTFKPNQVLSKSITVVYSGDSNYTGSTLIAPKLPKSGL